MSKHVDDGDLRRIAEQIKIKHGYDFLNYAQSSFRRRVQRILELKNLTVSDLLRQIDRHPAFIDELLKELTVPVTEMFRDPHFWTLMRNTILPKLATRGHLRIWHTGCSTGEEVISMAILLTELGLYPNTTILATDLDDALLRKAREGAFPLKAMELNNKNYRACGGTRELHDYFRINRDKAVFHRELLSGISFEVHDLVTGSMARRFDLILCRNVMIYFNQDLQNEVLERFYDNLTENGYLAIGSKESLAWQDVNAKFRQDDRESKVYRKISP